MKLSQTGRIALTLGIGWSVLAHAEKISFFDKHSGIIVGAGTYYRPFVNQNAFDPVPELASDGTTVVGSKSSLMLPLKLGFFYELPLRTFIEVYGRYVMNISKGWTVSGTHNGTGNTTWSSYGGGTNIGFSFLTWTHFRFQLVGNAEYVFEKALLSIRSNEAGSEELNIKSTAMLAGGGLRFEAGAIDAWVLSLFGGYQYGLKGTWSAATAGSAFGVAQTGELMGAVSGTTISAQHGGVLVEACLKLNFY